MAARLLDIENIGRIGQMFLNGDLLRNILNDRFTCDEDDTDYNADAFNPLKHALSKIERMNPDLEITGVIWYWYPANKRMAVPAIVGKALPKEGWIISPCDDYLYQTLTTKANTSFTLEDGRQVYYFPINASDGNVVGALALTLGGEVGMYEKRYFTVDAIN